MNNDQIFVCPSQDKKHLPEVYDPEPTTPKVDRFSYAWNGVVARATAWPTAIAQGHFATWSTFGPHVGYCAPDVLDPKNSPIHSSIVEDPAGSIVIAESVRERNTTAYVHFTSDTQLDYANPTPGDIMNTVPPRHLEGFNGLYGDGHVKWRKFGATKGGEWTVQSGD